MINANMMYLRPGNLFKEFVIENNRQKVTSTGRGRRMKGRGRDDKCKHDVFKTWQPFQRICD